MKLQVEAYKKDYPREIHRPVEACSTFNCHGMTFASRRTWIENAAAVQSIIDDDEYQKVSAANLLPGDVVLYRDKSNGDIQHSGIVVGFALIIQQLEDRNPIKNPLILSKWGACHEVVHKLAECPYDTDFVEYYRMTG